MMKMLTLSLNRLTTTTVRPCAVCAAVFVPAEDVGSRLLTLMPADQVPVVVLMCGGCHSKWSHGATVAARVDGDAEVIPVLRQAERA